ncbi:MAG TPA: hypothetical protein VGY56_17970 [Verrucomicrobiae bacterium]|nr:hypothetical protein [Verrucomicrobiae bacterium]
MFDLEKSVAEWRRQMLAAGIKAPVPLDELEAHLRDEIVWQMRSGIDEQRAFEAAISQIGNGAELKKEFAKNKGLLRFSSALIERILGALWLVYCCRTLFLMVRFHTVNFRTGLLMLVLYVAGLYGSILLIRGAPMGRKIIRTIAVGFAVISLFVIVVDSIAFSDNIHLRLHTLRTAAFYFVSACLLCWPSFSKPTVAKM